MTGKAKSPSGASHLLRSEGAQLDLRIATTLRLFFKTGDLMSLATDEAGDCVPATIRFEARGFSKRTIRTLLACAIDCPERLLFVHEDLLSEIPGIGPASLAEIASYRAKHLR